MTAPAPSPGAAPEKTPPSVGPTGTIGLGPTGTNAVAPDPKGQDLTREGLLAPAPRDGLGRPVLGGIALTRKLGQGGMGAVYYGRHPRLGIEVAVKVLPFHLAEQNPQSVEYFIREARVAVTLNHPNLVRVFDVLQEGQLYFLIMEYVNGTTAGGLLRERMKSNRGPLQELEALDIVITACEGLSAAHEQNIVHRDIKPDNIIIPVDEKGGLQVRRAKVMDLGLAKDMDQGGMDITGTNIAMGTPGYMSPEQAESAKTVTTATDIFAMGGTLYALLTGSAPFGGTTVLQVMRKTAEEAHKPVTALNPTVSDLTARAIDMCLAKKPEQRFRTAMDLGAQLRECRAAISGGPAQTARTVVRHDTKKVDPHPEAKTQPQPDAKAPPKPETAPEAKPQAKPEARPEPAPAPPPKKRGVPVMGCLFVLLLLGLGGAGAWFWFMQEQPYRKLMTEAAELEAGGQWDDAIALYDQAVEKYFFRRDAARAKRDAAQQAKKIDESYAQLLGDAARAEHNRDWDKAETLYDQALKVKKTADAEAGRARVVRTRDEYLAALREGNAALAASRWDDAERHFKTAQKVDDSLAVKEGLAKVERGRKEGDARAKRMSEIRERRKTDPGGAWGMLRDAIAKEPEDVALRLEAADLALSAKKEEWYTTGIEDAIVAKEHGKGEDAARAARLKTDLEAARRAALGGDDGGLADRVKAAIESGDLDAAEKLLDGAPPRLRSALAFYRRQIDALREHSRAMAAGKAAEDGGRWADAIAAYDKAAEIERPREKRAAQQAADRVRKRTADALADALRRAEGHLANGAFDPATAALQEAEKLDARHPDVRRVGLAIALGQARDCKNRGDHTGAAAAARRALTFDPGNAEAKAILEDAPKRNLVAEAQEALRAGKRLVALGLAKEAARQSPEPAGLRDLANELWPELLMETDKSTADAPVEELLLSPDGQSVFGAGPGHMGVASWRLSDLNVVVPPRNLRRASSICVVPGVKKLAAVYGGHLAFIDFANLGAPVVAEVTIGRDKIPIMATGVTTAPDGSGVIVARFKTGGVQGPDYYELQVYDQTGQGRTRLSHERAQTHGRFAPADDGKTLVSGGGRYTTYKSTGARDEENKIDPNVYLWTIAGGQVASKDAMGYDGGDGEVLCLAVAPGAGIAVAGTSAGKLLVFDLAAKKLKSAIDARGSVTSVSTDGVRAAMAAGGKLRIVLLSSGAVIDGPGSAQSVLVLPDDKGVVVGAERRLRRLEPKLK